MNSEKPLSSEIEIAYLEQISNPAGQLQLEHASDTAIIEAVRGALEAEGVLEDHQDLFVEAESISAGISEIIAELLNDNTAKSFRDYHKTSLESAKADAERYHQICVELVSVVNSLGYEIAVNDEVYTPTSPDITEDQRVQKNETIEDVPVPTPTPVVEETVPEVVSVPEADESVPTLQELYARADESVLKVYSQEKDKMVFKKLSVILAEVKEVFVKAQFNTARSELFMHEVLGRIAYDITNLNKQRSGETDKVKRGELNVAIKAKYRELLESIAGFLQTEKVDEAIGELDRDLPEPTHEDVDEQLTGLLAQYEAIKDKIADSELASRLAALVETISRYNEPDPLRQVIDKTKYIEKLTAYLGEVGDVSVAAEPETPQVASPETQPTLAMESEGKKYEDHFTLKAAYREKQQAYKDALSAYYQDDSLKARLRTGADSVRELLGLKAELPEHLRLLQNEYKQIRALYADSLDEALLNRSERDQNARYSSDSNTTKAAFATKFILKPQQEFLSLQERSMLTPEQQVKVQSALRFLSKHKWTTRAGLVAMAGVAGAVSGGATMAIAGAGLQAGKLAASFGAASGAGFLTTALTKDGVAAARSGFAEAERNVTEKFTIDNLDQLEQELETARTTKDVAEKRQKVATVGAGVLAGGLTGFGLSAEAEPVSSLSYKNTPEIETIMQTEPVPAETSRLSAEALARVVAAENAPAPEMPALPVSIAEITVPYEGLDNTKLSYETVLSDVKIVGTLTEQSLSEAERAEVASFLKLKANDLLSAHPNISESKLETELFEKLQSKFGGAGWWTGAQITGVDIGNFVVRPVATLAEATAQLSEPLEVTEESVAAGVKITLNDSASYTEAAPATPAVTGERVSDIYTVEKGDTLYGIAEKQFAAKLAYLPPIERGEILDSLFAKVEQYPELKDSLGLRSGDVDLIYPEEKLNLSGLEAELTVLLERREIIEQFKQSAPLTVEADDEVKSVPITVVEKPVPAGTVIETSTASYTEAKPEAAIQSSVAATEEIATPPRPFALNGQYADQPAYKEYIQSVFGSAKAYEQAVERAVQSFDNGTYDVFERSSFLGGNVYESPYRLLGEMSLAEVTEFEKQPNSDIRAFLNENNIKYDTYLAWLDKIDEMIKVLPNQAETKVSDLFARYVVEIETPKTNSLIK